MSSPANSFDRNDGTLVPRQPIFPGHELELRVHTLENGKFRVLAWRRDIQASTGKQRGPWWYETGWVKGEHDSMEAAIAACAGKF
jgi:hypothetical protein